MIFFVYATLSVRYEVRGAESALVRGGARSVLGSAPRVSVQLTPNWFLGHRVGAQSFRPAYPKLVPLGEPAPRQNPIGSELPSLVRRGASARFWRRLPGFPSSSVRGHQGTTDMVP